MNQNNDIMTLASGNSTDLDIPLCVDLDGTLLKSDVLVEGLLRYLRINIFNLAPVIYWLLRGKARLKAEIARRVPLNVALLPANEELLTWLRTEHQKGRRLVLCTASHSTEAERVATRFGIFESTLGSDALHNLAGRAKATLLTKRFGEQGFDYAGNELKDMSVWRNARRAIVVAPSLGLRWRLKSLPQVERIFLGSSDPVGRWIRALRVHQWAKNLLIFVPALAAHRILDPQVALSALLAFLWFGICASGTYLINDLLDLDADRMHAHKRTRPLASGSIPLAQGIVGAALLLVAAFAGSLLTVGPLFSATLLLYAIVTLWYSLSLKRIAMVDALALAGLYSLRVIAGGAATGVAPSFWLLAFSMFMFLSLAMVKRYSELSTLQQDGQAVAAGRGYTTIDLPLLLACGISSGFTCVLVLALFINLGTGLTYSNPNALWLLCPLLLYWVCRIWRKTYRGEMHHDPVVFALRDRPSLAVGLIGAVLFWAATHTFDWLL